MCLSGLWQQGLRVWFCDKRLGLGLRLGLRLPLLGPASECVCAEQLRWWHLRETIQQKERKWQTSKAVRGGKKKKKRKKQQYEFSQNSLLRREQIAIFLLFPFQRSYFQWFSYISMKPASFVKAFSQVGSPSTPLKKSIPFLRMISLIELADLS